MTTSFTIFEALPPELRNKIWRAALPDDVGPALFFYKHKRYWCARRLKRSEPGYIPRAGVMTMDFRTDLLGDDIHLYMPLVLVNREARSIAIDWLEQQGFDAKNLHPHHHIMTRTFNYDSDALYISDEQWEGFLEEPCLFRSRRGLYNRHVKVHPNVSRFAVSESFFTQRNLLERLPDVETWMDLRVVFVVVGAQPDVRQRTVRWKLEDVDKGAFIWDRERQDFDFRRGTGTLVDADAYRRIGDAARAHLPKGLLQHHNMKTLEIRPVSVGRKHNYIC
ncbi:hypothetical protein NHJ13051_002393 [Beauveria bassiana]